MIEGLRLAPWFAEMNSRNELAISDCVKCKRMSTSRERQSLGCGYEPRLDRVHLDVWRPPIGASGYSGPDPEWCAGYTTKLPEVSEATMARLHWSKGNLPMGSAPEDLLTAIVILEGANSSVEHWRMTPVSEGGGRL